MLFQWTQLICRLWQLTTQTMTQRFRNIQKTNIQDSITFISTLIWVLEQQDINTGLNMQFSAGQIIHSSSSGAFKSEINTSVTAGPSAVLQLSKPRVFLFPSSVTVSWKSVATNMYRPNKIYIMRFFDKGTTKVKKSTFEVVRFLSLGNKQTTNSLTAVSVCLVCRSPQSSTVLRCPRGDTAATTLCGRHSDFSAVLPQHDQWGRPGCPLWPWPQPLKPPGGHDTTQRSEVKRNQGWWHDLVCNIVEQALKQSNESFTVLCANSHSKHQDWWHSSTSQWPQLELFSQSCHLFWF